MSKSLVERHNQALMLIVEHAKTLDRKQKRIEAYEDALERMFRADTDYGEGFYGQEKWRQAYFDLQKMIGYDGPTAVFDPAHETLY